MEKKITDLTGAVGSLKESASTALGLWHTHPPKVDRNGIVVETKGLTKTFGDETAVDALTCHVSEGSIFGLIGPSGCGKTTTVRLMIGSHKPSAGVVTVLGKNPLEFDWGMRRKIGYMPQEFVLYPNLTVWENLTFAASIYGLNPHRRTRLHELLEFVQLTEHCKKRSTKLSGGMRRRLSLAATLVHDPNLLFLDEPTGGIDPLLRQKMWDHFHELKADGRTLLITTQYVSEAAYCDRVGLMVEGRMVAIDTPAALRRRALEGETIDLKTMARLDATTLQLLKALAFVHRVVRTGDRRLRLTVDEANTAIPKLMEWHKTRGIPIESIQEYVPSFDQVFVRLVERNGS